MHKVFAFANDTRTALLALWVLALTMFLPGFFSIPPIDRDEARFAQATKQMIETGDYFDIRYQQETRYKKPVGIYWLQAASTKVFGTPPYNQIWTYRIPSFIGAVMALWLTYLIGRTLVSAPIGLGAALLLASSLILPVEARLAKTDAMLLATILLAIWPLAKNYMLDGKFSWGEALLFWLAVAAGILIKGPIIVMVLGTMIAALCILQKSSRLFLNLRPLVGLLIVLLCVAPWLIAITIKSKGAFWAESVGHDMLGKVASGQESHGLPPGVHLGLLVLLFLPAIVAIVRGIFYGWKNRNDRIVQFLLAWIIPTWLIFEFTPTKLPHYTMPTYPALALLAAMALSRLDWSDRRMRLAFAIPVALALAINIKLLGIIGPNLPNFWLAQELQTTLAQHDLSARPLAIVGYAEPSAVFLNGTQTELLASAGEGALAIKSGAVVAVAADKVTEFQDALKQKHIDADMIAAIDGFNLGRGKAMTLTLYSGHD